MFDGKKKFSTRLFLLLVPQHDENGENTHIIFLQKKSGRPIERINKFISVPSACWIFFHHTPSIFYSRLAETVHQLVSDSIDGTGIDAIFINFGCYFLVHGSQNHSRRVVLFTSSYSGFMLIFILRVRMHGHWSNFSPYDAQTLRRTMRHSFQRH